MESRSDTIKGSVFCPILPTSNIPKFGIQMNMARKRNDELARLIREDSSFKVSWVALFEKVSLYTIERLPFDTWAQSVCGKALVITEARITSLEGQETFQDSGKMMLCSGDSIIWPKNYRIRFICAADEVSLIAMGHIVPHMNAA